MPLRLPYHCISQYQRRICRIGVQLEVMVRETSQLSLQDAVQVQILSFFSSLSSSCARVLHYINSSQDSKCIAAMWPLGLHSRSKLNLMGLILLCLTWKYSAPSITSILQLRPMSIFEKQPSSICHDRYSSCLVLAHSSCVTQLHTERRILVSQWVHCTGSTNDQRKNMLSDTNLK